MNSQPSSLAEDCPPKPNAAAADPPPKLNAGAELPAPAPPRVAPAPPPKAGVAADAGAAAGGAPRLKACVEPDPPATEPLPGLNKGAEVAPPTLGFPKISAGAKPGAAADKVGTAAGACAAVVATPPKVKAGGGCAAGGAGGSHGGGAKPVSWGSAKHLPPQLPYTEAAL